MGLKTDRVFVVIGRCNQLFILCILMLVLFNLGKLFYLQTTAPDKSPRISFGSGSVSSDSVKTRLGDFSRVLGTHHFYAPLAPAGGSSRDARTIRAVGSQNLLFFDSQTSTSRWLLKSDDQRIEAFETLSDPLKFSCRVWIQGDPACKDLRTANALLLVLSTAGGSTSSQRIAIASTSGEDLRDLATGVEEFKGVVTMDDSQALVAYKKDGELRVMDIDPVTRVLRSDNSMGVALPPGT